MLSFYPSTSVVCISFKYVNACYRFSITFNPRNLILTVLTLTPKVPLPYSVSPGLGCVVSAQWSASFWGHVVAHYWKGMGRRYKVTDWRHVSNMTSTCRFLLTFLKASGLTWRRSAVVRTSRGLESDWDTLQMEGQSWWRSGLWGQNWQEEWSGIGIKLQVSKLWRRKQTEVNKYTATPQYLRNEVFLAPYSVVEPLY